MNEQIRELFLQADFPRFDIENEAQRFAELIVKECADIAFEQWALTHDSSPQEAILKYFGVDND